MEPDVCSISQQKQDEINAVTEQKRLALAAQQTDQAISLSEEQVRREQGEEFAQIFAAHRLILQDPSFLPEAEQRIQQQGMSAEQAVLQVGEEAAAMLTALDDEYFRERAADVKAVTGQLLGNLQGGGKSAAAAFPEIGSYIVVADELTPAETVALPKQRVAGFIVRKGGKTSHAAILARTYSIPAVVGLQADWRDLEALTYVRMDGEDGWVEAITEEQFAAETEIQATASEPDSLYEQSPLVQAVTLAANIGSPADLPFAAKFHAQGIGLYRTEFLFMGVSLPSEEEQVEAYRAVIAACTPHTTVIRTLDIGGDKQAPALNLPKEQNPFLGVRALRLCFARPDIFHTQLRAIWRASAAGATAVMFPMIATIEELRQAKLALEQARQAVIDDGYPVGAIEVGMMMEIPSAALIARHLAREVDFFSIGTNDLTQYTLAVDRENSALHQINQPYHPAVLQLIASISQAAQTAGIWTGICGEAGGDPFLAPFFAALGIDELSMAPGQLPKVRKKLAALTFAPEERAELVQSVLNCASQDEVRVVLSRYSA
jgi:phosphotransferase system enzyme I (PtsI)